MEAFVTSFNRNRTKYGTTDNNSQHFAQEFLAHFAPESHFHIPVSAKETRQDIFASVSKSVGGMSLSLSVREIEKAIRNMGLPNVAKMTLETLAKDVGLQSLKEFLGISGARVSQEVAENDLSLLSKGATSWWNLLQIPMEIGVKILLRSDLVRCTELEAYVDNKLVSMGTATAVGFWMAEPLGALGSTGLWLLTEVISYFISIWREVYRLVWEVKNA